VLLEYTARRPVGARKTRSKVTQDAVGG